MVTIAICEDEAIMLEELNLRIKCYLDSCNISSSISEFQSGEEIIQSGQHFHLIFMDIKLSGINGMQTIQKLQNQGSKSQVIFITSYKSYVFDAFNVDAVHYLIKPVCDHDLFRAIDKAISRLSQQDCQTISIVKANGVQIIYLKDILYCESLNHQIIIHTQTEQFHYFGTLEKLQKQLDDRFFRCHRSYIVNLNYVVSKEKETAVMAGGEIVLISRRKQQEFSKNLLLFFTK